jgi:hypothetical protein
MTQNAHTKDYVDNQPDYLYKTVRAEWTFDCYHQDDVKSFQTFGPYPTRDIAHAQALLIHDQWQDTQLHTKLVYKEVPVELDPILSEVLKRISNKISSWIDLKMIHKKNRRNNIYFSEHVVRASLKSLAKDVSDLTFATNLENRNAETENG